MTFFRNGTIQVKNTGTFFNGQPIFEIFELVDEGTGVKSWHFCTKIAARGAAHAFQKYKDDYE